MARRFLRLIAAASILAFALTARTVVVTYAATGDSTMDPSAVVGDLPPVIQGDPLSADPPPTEPPPTEPPPANPEPPAAAEEPPPPDVIDPPPVETLPDPSPTDAPVATDPPPADAVDTTTTDPPSDTGTTDPPPEPDAGVSEVPLVDPVEPPAVEPPPPDDPPPPDADPRESPVAAELLPGEEAPAATDPTEASSETPITTSSHGWSDRAGADSKAAVSVSARAPGQRIATAPRPATSARTESTSDADVVRTNSRRDLVGDTAFDPAAAASAGLAAGLAVTNRAPVSVAVAIEFGRVGGGWAGSIVFNLWLRRQLRERQMSQRQLAALSGVDHSTISRLLREDRRPSLTTATKLVRALKHVRPDEAEPEAAQYFERTPEESIFPARRVELALRADEQLDDDQVRRLMMIYLEARRRHEPAARSRAAPARSAALPTAVPARAAPSSRS